MIWTDNMLIPKGAANKYTAELMMDFVYDPEIAAQIAACVYYVSPVKGAADEIKALDPEAATNPLLFPPPEIVREAARLPGAEPGAGGHDATSCSTTCRATRPTAMTATADDRRRDDRPATGAGCATGSGRRAVAPARARPAVAAHLLRAARRSRCSRTPSRRGRSRTGFTLSLGRPTTTSRR